MVHDVSVPGTFLGFIPASRTETQVLAVLGHVSLARYPVTGYLADTGAGIWQIEGVRFDMRSVAPIDRGESAADEISINVLTTPLSGF